MCGIAGILSRNNEAPDRLRLVRMIDQLGHRGPDGRGFHLRGPVGLAHARLSIIDLAGGAQPIRNETGDLWVVFNGEIFNYLELRRWLEARGHRFYTHSDTEVLVHLYEEEGEGFVQHLNGQFAIALWDARDQSMLLVRDRVGIAPLYYALGPGELLFGSEVKAILAACETPPRLNLRALDQLFTFWSPVAPETLFEGIHELPPGELIRIDAQGVQQRRYWDFQFPEAGGFSDEPEETLALNLLELLRDATRLRLRADVPVGAYLSGGLDSSVLAALVRQVEEVNLRTFSIGFDHAGLDESAQQDEVIRHLGVDHQRFHCDGATVAAELDRTVWHAEMPMLRSAPVPMRLLSQQVRAAGFKVVLTGEGADEILGGYDLFKEAKVRRFWAAQPDSVRRPLLLQRLYPWLDLNGGEHYLRSFFGQALDDPDGPWFSHLPRWTTTAQAKRMFSRELQAALPAGTALQAMAARLPVEYSRWHPFNRAQYLEARSLMGGYLLAAQGDRMLMANAVEGRFPYLDHRLMEFAARLPPRLKMKVLREKHLLREAMRHALPPAVLERPKQPYRAHDAAAFVGADREHTLLMEADMVRDYGYFDPVKVNLLLRKAQSGRALGYRDHMAFMGVLTTQLWHRHFIARFGANFRRDASGDGTTQHAEQAMDDNRRDAHYVQ